jgi:hypothetical protein
MRSIHVTIRSIHVTITFASYLHTKALIWAFKLVLDLNYTDRSAGWSVGYVLIYSIHKDNQIYSIPWLWPMTQIMRSFQKRKLNLQEIDFTVKISKKKKQVYDEKKLLHKAVLFLILSSSIICSRISPLTVETNMSLWYSYQPPSPPLALVSATRFLSFSLFVISVSSKLISE